MGRMSQPAQPAEAPPRAEGMGVGGGGQAEPLFAPQCPSFECGGLKGAWGHLRGTMQRQRSAPCQNPGMWSALLTSVFPSGEWGDGTSGPRAVRRKPTQREIVSPRHHGAESQKS